MKRDNTSIKMGRHGDFLGPKLEMLLILLNQTTTCIWKMAAIAPSEAELAVRKNFIIRSGEKHPNWLLGTAHYNPAFATVASVSELQDILRHLVSAWIATGELYEWGGSKWIATGVHDPKHRSLSDNALEFTGYADWRDSQKFNVSEGGAGWKDRLYLTLESGRIDKPRIQAYEIMRQLFMSSERERFHLAQCIGCGLFFWRESLSLAKRGLYCSSNCQNKRSSKDTRRDQRLALLEKRLDRAAAAFAKSSIPFEAKTANNPTFKAAILKVVNKGKESGEDDITLSWVSRHWEAIGKRPQSRKEKSR